MFAFLGLRRRRFLPACRGLPFSLLLLLLVVVVLLLFLFLGFSDESKRLQYQPDRVLKMALFVHTVVPTRSERHNDTLNLLNTNNTYFKITI